MRDHDFIVSKTDPKGRITYGNEIFIEFSGYTERELIGSQHNIIRHPDMPRGAFKLVWDTIAARKECFAYVKNMAKDGSYYWVFANITPDYDKNDNVIGYFSVRRKPRDSAVATIRSVYEQMLAVERRAGPATACEASVGFLNDFLAKEGTTYDRLILEI